MKATLTRQESSDEGTFGKFVIDGGGFECYSGELPIPPTPKGKYEVTWCNHPEHGWCFQIQNVPGHDGILIHIGNFCGDVNKGKKSDSKGCIILGNAISEIAGQKALLNSGDAMRRFIAYTEMLPFELTIE